MIKILLFAHYQNRNMNTTKSVSPLNASLTAQPSNFAPYAPLSFSGVCHVSIYCLLCVVWAFQRSAMKPYTCAIMTLESLGDEFTCVTWNSAHVWQGKSTVKESATQVRHAISFCCSAPSIFCRSSVICFCWADESESQ